VRTHPRGKKGVHTGAHSSEKKLNAGGLTKKKGTLKKRSVYRRGKGPDAAEGAASLEDLGEDANQAF